jgi:hypothetical protein
MDLYKGRSGSCGEGHDEGHGDNCLEGSSLVCGHKATFCGADSMMHSVVVEVGLMTAVLRALVAGMRMRQRQVPDRLLLILCRS